VKPLTDAVVARLRKLAPEAVLDQRFAIEREVAAGGMGIVYRARDLARDRPVALKLLVGSSAADAERFRREAALLKRARHPGVVEYVAHGVTPEGEAYLAMEWLEGRTLAERLRREERLPPLAVARLGLAVARALREIHALGVVHRDVKPSNLFLVGDDVTRVKLLDFGIARGGGSERTVTAAGQILGSVAYMSPEQARGAPILDARGDVFSLGCVLYRALTGRDAFEGDDALAILSRVLLDDPAPMGLGGDLEALVTKMLARDVEARPDANEVHGALAAICEALARDPSPPLSRPVPPRESPRKRWWLYARGVPAALVGGAASSFAPRVEALGDGTIVVGLPFADVATDQAVLAARCACAIAAAAPDAAISVARDRRAPRAFAPGVWVDEELAGLVDARFEIARDAAGARLVAERRGDGRPRVVLGKETPFVGRAAEIALLRSLLEDALARPAARAALVLGETGIGKSRLAYELVRTLSGARVLLAAGDPVRAGSPFAIVAQLIRCAADTDDGTPLSVRRARIEEMVARVVAEDERARVAPFLSELAGAPSLRAPLVSAARADARLMADQARRAFEDWLQAECARAPLVLVLEDLHWADVTSVKLVDDALRHLRDRPFFVLALARPNVREIHRRLWTERVVTTLTLPELTPRASEELSRAIVGEGAEAGAIARVVANGAGNPFYIEELSRAVHEGGPSLLPSTVKAMIDSRLAVLSPGARRVLRAACVFGEHFSRAGVEALVARPEVDAALEELAENELVARVSGDDAYAFRHALVREAVLGALGPKARRRAFRAAGAWLERVAAGEEEGALVDAGPAAPAVIADFMERGGRPKAATRWYARAAEQALRGDDLEGVMAAGERAIALGAHGARRVRVRQLQAEAAIWQNEAATAERFAREALADTVPGKVAWFRALAALVEATVWHDNEPQVVEWAERLTDVPVKRACRAAFARVVARAMPALLVHGAFDLADALLTRVGRFERYLAEHEPASLAWTLHARSWRALYTGDFGECHRLDERVVATFMSVSDLRHACRERASIGYDELLLGAYDRAERSLREASAVAERMGLSQVQVIAKHNLGLVVAYLGRPEEGLAIELEAIAAATEYRRMLGASHKYAALIRLLMGDTEGAEGDAREAIACWATLPSLRATGYAVLARVFLDRGRAAEALASANEGMSLLGACEHTEEGRAFVRLVHAEALLASGEREKATLAIAGAREELLAHAARIKEPMWRASFLERVPENARTLTLAREWTLTG
jgi:hypothetical protein